MRYNHVDRRELEIYINTGTIFSTDIETIFLEKRIDKRSYINRLPQDLFKSDGEDENDNNSSYSFSFPIFSTFFEGLSFKKDESLLVLLECIPFDLPSCIYDSTLLPINNIIHFWETASSTFITILFTSFEFYGFFGAVSLPIHNALGSFVPQVSLPSLTSSTSLEKEDVFLCGEQFENERWGVCLPDHVSFCVFSTIFNPLGIYVCSSDISGPGLIYPPCSSIKNGGVLF